MSPRTPDGVKIRTPELDATSLHVVRSSLASTLPTVTSFAPQITIPMPVLVNSLPFMQFKSRQDFKGMNCMYPVLQNFAVWWTG